jgi:serine/threonine protein kinase
MVVRRNVRNYDTSRWKDAGPLIPGTGKEFVRQAAEKTSGRKAVVKHVDLSKSRRVQSRFWAEALNMHRMSDTPGILPVWDVDDTRPDQPQWYAMPRARLLADALDDDATLWDIVGHIAFLADVLARLADQGTYHRDIKPANLFWWDGGPVLADFGIAAWGSASSRAGTARQASPTLKGEKLGPANFIAPEMRHNRPADRGKRADVYSLAKTLFVLALPERGPYPPDGTHRADSGEFSLWEAGGDRPSLSVLRHVLEAATEFDPRRRLPMADFRDELRAWLHRYDRVEFRRRGDRPRRRGFEALLGMSERARRDREETESMMTRCISKIAEALTGDQDASFAQNDDGGGDVLGDYGWVDNTEYDGFMPDNGTIWMATEVHDGRRIILEAVLDDKVCFLAECQTSGPPWRLEQQWGRTEWVRPRMPRTADLVEKLAEDVVAWLAKTADAG